MLISLGTISAGLIAAAAIWRARRTEQQTMSILDGTAPPEAGRTIKVRLTGYYPFQSGLNAEQRLMEGGANDRKGNRLHTLEDHLADPVNHPYVSVSGDDAYWPYGQRIIIANWPEAVFRVVDTGGHFSSAAWAIKRGFRKVIKAAGYEPLDVCVASSSTRISPVLSSATILAGDNFDGGREVAQGLFDAQEVG